MDLVGFRDDGRLVHAELQGYNDPDMGWRMLEPLRPLHDLYGQKPIQVVIYVGREKMNMPSGIEEEDLIFRFRLIDIRTWDRAEMLASPKVGDNILSMLCGEGDNRETIRAIVGRILDLPPNQRADALAKLAIISGLRKLESIVEEEIQTVPMMIDPMENVILRRLHDKGVRKGLEEGLETGLEKGLAKGRELGREEGREEGRLDGRRETLRLLIRHKFASLPAWAGKRLQCATASELDGLTIRVGEAKSLKDLFRQ